MKYIDLKGLTYFKSKLDGTYLKTTGTAVAASKLASSRKLGVNLGSTASVTFDGSADATNIPITGTLAVANGGTGITSNPSMLVSLGSTEAANVFLTSPRPGVGGTLPLGNGGTGATTAAAARSNLGVYSTTDVDNKISSVGTEIKNAVAGVYKYKGSVAAEANLPTSGQTAGDVYNIAAASTYGAAGMNVAWTGTAWDALGSNVDISGATVASANKWTNARTLSLTGDITGSVSLDGSADASLATTLPSSGVSAGTYGDYDDGYCLVPKITVNSKGLVTSIKTSYSNPGRLTFIKNTDSDSSTYKYYLAASHNTGERVVYRDDIYIAGNSLYSAGSKVLTEASTTIPAAVAVKGNAETTYRTGNVNLTPANLGITVVNNTADADKSVKYATSAGTAVDSTARDNASSAMSRADEAYERAGNFYDVITSYLPLAGGTMTGQIQKSGVSTSWVAGRDGAMIRQNSIDGYSPMLSAKTANGSWEMGPFTNNNLHFTYITDANYDAGTNTQTVDISLNADGTLNAPSLSEAGTTLANKYQAKGSYAAASHTHNYAGSNSAGGAANSVANSLVVKLNGGAVEGTNLFTYNGGAAKTINITPSSIGSAPSAHQHSNLDLVWDDDAIPLVSLSIDSTTATSIAIGSNNVDGSDTSEFTLTSATTSIAGLMSAADKSKLDGLSAPTKETWTFTLEDGSTVSKTVRLG